MEAFAKNALRKMRSTRSSKSGMQKIIEMHLKREAFYMSTCDSEIAKQAVMLPKYSKYLPHSKGKEADPEGTDSRAVEHPINSLGASPWMFTECSPDTLRAEPIGSADDSSGPACEEGSANRIELVRLLFA